MARFVADDGTASGSLMQIRRVYVQDGTVVSNAVVEVDSIFVYSVAVEYCAESAGYFEKMGGLKRLGQAFGRGMVLVFSIWNDRGACMNWLDSGSAGQDLAIAPMEIRK